MILILLQLRHRREVRPRRERRVQLARRQLRAAQQIRALPVQPRLQRQRIHQRQLRGGRREMFLLQLRLRQQQPPARHEFIGRVQLRLAREHAVRVLQQRGQFRPVAEPLIRRRRLDRRAQTQR